MILNVFGLDIAKPDSPGLINVCITSSLSQRERDDEKFFHPTFSPGGKGVMRNFFIQPFPQGEKA